MAQKVCIACSGTSYKIFLLTNLNQYLQRDTGETEINLIITVNNGSENFQKKNTRLQNLSLVEIFILNFNKN